MQAKQAIILLMLIAIVCSSFYSYSPCTSPNYLNTANMKCVQCSDANHIANNYQAIPIACQCKAGYKSGTNNVCSALSATACLAPLHFYPLFGIDGNVNATAQNCSSCSNNSYTNANGTACIPCSTGMNYSQAQGCYCTGTSSGSELGCFNTILPSSIQNSLYSKKLKYLIPGCYTHQDFLSCSYIANLCSYSMASMSTAECQFFPSYNKSNYLYPDSNGFSLTSSKGLSLSLKLVSYLATGNYLGQKKLLLGDIMRCGTPSNSEIAFTLGTNMQASCSYDFNNLVSLMSSKHWKSKTYQLLIQGDGNTYYDVPVYMPGATQAIRRFFLEDTYSYSNKINVLSSFVLSFTMDSSGKLINPKFTPTYTLLSTDVGTGIVPQGSGQLALSFSILYSSDLTNFWTGAIASFISISVIAIVHTAIKTYIGHLNRKSALLFFLNFIGVYSLWLFYYLLFMTGYWFLFTKTTSSPYLLIPVQDQALATVFYVLVAVMVLFRIGWAAIDKSDKLSTEVFLINWERSQFRNSWRQIFIVNSLAQFYTYRTVSLFWMLAILMFFMNGVGWEKLAAETISTDTATIYSTLTKQSRILLYFLSCAVFLAIGLIFKILRRLSVLVWPYPFEDFVDYCSVTNISFLFVKRRSPHAFYLHAALPDRTEVTYKEINEAIRRGLQKNRSIANQLPSQDSLRLYSIYLSKEIEDKHTQMLKNIEDQDHAKRMKYGKQASRKPVNFREQFIEGRLKPHLEGMSSRQNDDRRKTLLQNLCGMPPVDLREEGALRNRSQVFFDDQLELVNQVFPNGNQFQQIHTLIVIFLGWVTLTNSCAIAAFLTYFVDEYIIKGWVSYSCRVNLQSMTKVKRGFMI